MIDKTSFLEFERIVRRRTSLISPVFTINDTIFEPSSITIVETILVHQNPGPGYLRGVVVNLLSVPYQVCFPKSLDKVWI